MSSRDIFAGIFSGLAERSREKQETLLAQEMARQKAAAEFWKSMADRPDIRPEARDRFLQKYALVLNNAPGKKLPKEASLDTLFDEIQPQVGSPSWQGGQTTREVTATPMPIPGSLEDPLKPSVPPPVTMSAPVPQPPPGYGMSPFYSPDEQRAQTQRDLEAQLATRAKFAGQTAEAEEAAKAKYREAPAPRPIDARSPQGIAAELQLEEEKKKRGLGTYALKPDTSMSEVELAMAAAGGDKQAKMALDLLTRMKTAGQIEGGVYTAITDRRGVVQGFVNPKTRQVIRMEDLGFEGENFKGAMGIDRQTREEAASSGLRAITKFREEMKKNPNLLAQLAIPGSPGARTARAARAEMVDVLTRIRTGAALNDSEEEFYTGQAPSMLDQLFADPDTVNYKLSIFEDNFKALAPPSALKPNAPPGTGGGGRGAASGGTTRMRRQNGSEFDVPNDKVEAAKAQGAVVVTPRK